MLSGPRFFAVILFVALAAGELATLGEAPGKNSKPITETSTTVGTEGTGKNVDIYTMETTHRNMAAEESEKQRKKFNKCVEPKTIQESVMGFCPRLVNYTHSFPVSPLDESDMQLAISMMRTDRDALSMYRAISEGKSLDKKCKLMLRRVLCGIMFPKCAQADVGTGDETSIIPVLHYPCPFDIGRVESCANVNLQTLNGEWDIDQWKSAKEANECYTPVPPISAKDGHEMRGTGSRLKVSVERGLYNSKETEAVVRQADTRDMSIGHPLYQRLRRALSLKVPQASNGGYDPGAASVTRPGKTNQP